MVTLSVVMSVYNGASSLDDTLRSILDQTERDFELIVVDDGSTDTTPSILAACRDPRLRVLTQANTGLTRALIRGCAEARGEFIARHDAGDRSRPDRFRKQLDAFTADVVLVSCATSYHAPRGERLYVVRGDAGAVQRSLRSDGVDAIRGLTHHGSAMFRRDAYLAAGGYRESFHFAQDLDLWVRLARLGGIAFVDDVLYEARVDVGAISSTNRAEQIELARIALAIRDEPAREPELLAEAARIGPRNRARTRRDVAKAHYFIAACLRRERDARWRGYALRAVRALLVGR
jgi:glycosyltransferase involved in cell wall biosynthesis